MGSRKENININIKIWNSVPGMTTLNGDTLITLMCIMQQKYIPTMQPMHVTIHNSFRSLVINVNVTYKN